MPRTEAAKYLGLTAKTLANWCTEGRGPKSVLIGSRRFYYRAALDNFINEEADKGEDS